MFKRKGGGAKDLLNNVKKKLHFSYGTASLIMHFLLYGHCKQAYYA